MRYFLEGGTVWTNDGDLIEDARIVIEENEIVELAEPGDLEETPGEEDEVLDVSEKLIIPGMVNAHTHLYSTLARGLPLKGYSPENLSDILTGLWWKLDRSLDKEAIRASALIGGMELIKNGVTTIFDHHSSPSYVKGSLELVEEEVVEKLGLRSSLCYEVTDRNGKEEAEQGIRENINWLSRVSNRDDNLTAGQFGLHASFTLSSETLAEVADYLEDLDTGIHIHLAEGREDQEDSLKNYGTRVVNRLDNFGLLDEKAILAHGLHLSEPEKEILLDQQPFLINNPRSNMNNGAGVADVKGLLDRGLKVGLGNDGFGSNMFDELRDALLLQKIYHGSSGAMGLEDVREMAFINNYELAGRAFGVELGKLRPGYKADLVVMDYPHPTPLEEETFLGHLYFGVGGNNYDVETVFVNGSPVMKESDILGVNEEEAYRAAREAAEDLWERIDG
ncbi:MAG: putative aminohydrolase SsnA [Candidatus Acetothermia bacterium]